MNEIALLKSLWGKKRRSLNLIATVTYSGINGRLNNDHWCFNVGYCFRDALDMMYQRRVKTKKVIKDGEEVKIRFPYSVWTQGSIIHFKEGDSLYAKDSDLYMQVDYSEPMGWDTEADAMFEGVVTYRSNGESEDLQTVTQMEFLKILIDGKGF